MATLKADAEELAPSQEVCVGLTRAMDDEGYETAGKDVKLKKKKVKSSPGMDDDGYETAGKKPLPRKQPTKDAKKDVKKSKTGSSADEPPTPIEDDVQGGDDEEDYVQRMISLIGSEVDCSGLSEEALKLLRLIPDGYVPLPHQVGGHRYLDGKPGFLRRIGEAEIFYKLVQPGSKGVVEVSFYDALSQTSTSAGDPTMFRSLTELHDKSSQEEVDMLKELIPRYYGLKAITDRLGVASEYLVLEDLTSSFSKPSILDLKLGKRVWDDFADQEKIERELKKYPAQETLGFRIIGMRVYQPSKGNYQFYDRWFGRSVTTDTALDAVAGFFHVDGRRRYDVITTLMVQLQKFEQWLQTQKRVRLFATSIIVVYEGSTIPSNVEVRLVDFAHTYDYHYGDTAGKPDGNPLFGLRSYISFLERLLE